MKVKNKVQSIIVLILVSCATVMECTGQFKSSQLIGKWDCVDSKEKDENPIFGDGEEKCTSKLEFFQDHVYSYLYGERYKFDFSIIDGDILQLGNSYYEILELGKDQMVLKETRLNNPEILLFRDELTYVRQKEK